MSDNVPSATFRPDDPAPESAYDPRERLAMNCGQLGSRMRSRVEMIEQRDGDKAVNGPGVGIGYLFAKDIARALEQASEMIYPDEERAMTEEPTLEIPPREYALVEIFGHRQHYGEISDVERAGAKLLRIRDVDTNEVHFYGGAAIFSMTVISEARIEAHVAEVARFKKEREESEARWNAERARRMDALTAPSDDETVNDEERPFCEANKAHRAKINREALTALILCGLTEDQGKVVVGALAKGEVPHCKIEY